RRSRIGRVGGGRGSHRSGARAHSRLGALVAASWLHSRCSRSCCLLFLAGRGDAFALDAWERVRDEARLPDQHLQWRRGASWSCSRSGLGAIGFTPVLAGSAASDSSGTSRSRGAAASTTRHGRMRDCTCSLTPSPFTPAPTITNPRLILPPVALGPPVR